MSDDMKLRIGIGKHGWIGDHPWYVTIYNRALTQDSAQEWFKTHAEALAYANEMLPQWKCRYAR